MSLNTTTNTTKTKLLIIGSGPAGYTAAIYAARADLAPMLISGPQQGGQLITTSYIENYPGFIDSVSGPDLMERMKQQAIKFGTHIVNDSVINADFSSYPLTVSTEAAGDFKALSIIICSGADAKWLGLASEQKYRGFGVSGCAVCDAPFYRNKKVIVVGGGNVAVEEALYLAIYAEKVLLVHRRNTLRAEKIMSNKLLKNSKIEILWNTELAEVIGSDNPKEVTGAVLRSTQNNEMRKIDISGIFIAIGHQPNTTVFKRQLELDNEGYIVTSPTGIETNIKGVFAAGDVQDKIYKQAVTAAGTGCMAALAAEKYLSNLDISHD